MEGIAVDSSMACQSSPEKCSSVGSEIPDYGQITPDNGMIVEKNNHDNKALAILLSSPDRRGTLNGVSPSLLETKPLETSLPTAFDTSQIERVRLLDEGITLEEPVSMPESSPMDIHNLGKDYASRDQSVTSSICCAPNSEVSLQDGLVESNGPVLSDDIPSQAAEVLASLPSLIPNNDPHMSVFQERSNLTQSCLLSERAGNSYLQPGTLPDILQYSTDEAGSPNHGSLNQADLANLDNESKDPLETLANAALSEQVSNSLKSKEQATDKESLWCDVGVFKGSSCHVTSYYSQSSVDPDHEYITSDNMPDFSNSCKIELEPGTAYKFRICAVNSCGRGPWSEVSAFRTSLPGYPGAPSSVAISRSAEGAHLSWQPPSNPAGNIIEYTVCLAVKNPTLAHGVHTSQKLTLIKVYSGPYTQTIVSNACLAEAYVDTSSKPAIIFRIAAKNEKGFGPPTQVRWLQDIPDQSSSTKR